MSSTQNVGGPGCQPPSPAAVPLPVELEEEEEDEPMTDAQQDSRISLKELTEQIQAVMHRLDERARAAAESLMAKAQELSEVAAHREPTPTAHPRLTSLQQLLQQPDAEPTPVMPTVMPTASPVTRWSRVIRDAILDGHWELAGTVVCPVVARNSNPVYEQHEWKILRQAKNTVKDHGLKSEAARAMLDWIYTTDTNSPLDCANMARLLLSPSQFLVWHREWVRLAQLEANRPRVPQDILFGLTADMITGEGRFANIQLQLQYPMQLFQVVATTARQAYYAVPDSTPTPSFMLVRQGMTEAFGHFVDRLSQALTNHPSMDEVTKQVMFKMLAFENANTKTKAILATLPKGADVADMVEITLRAEQGNQGKAIAGAVAAAMKPTTNLIAAAVQGIRKTGPITQKKGNGSPVCFR
ncbi:GAK9 protein, partial [Nicator chloris]|nr:GAK9 protein [Nicator chloris]